MRRIIGMAIVGVALGALPALGQPAGEGPRDGGREGRKGPRGQALVEYLGLSEAQQNQWQTAMASHRDAMKPLHEEGQALHRRVREAVEAHAPDAVVGEAVKAAHAHRQKVREAREALEARLVSILDGQQKLKYEAFKAARKAGREGRRERGPRRGRPHGEEPPVEG